MIRAHRPTSRMWPFCLVLLSATCWRHHMKSVGALFHGALVASSAAPCGATNLAVTNFKITWWVCLCVRTWQSGRKCVGPIFGRFSAKLGAQSFSRTTGLVLQCRLHQKSARQTRPFRQFGILDFGSRAGSGTLQIRSGTAGIGHIVPGEILDFQACRRLDLRTGRPRSEIASATFSLWVLPCEGTLRNLHTIC